MLNFYVYEGSAPLGKEKLTCVRHKWDDLKTHSGAIRRAKRIYKGRPFTLYTFTNWYDDKTFKLILKGAKFPK